MEEYDVVIIGAGLAGLQCARLLGRRGFRILLVDRKPSVDRAIHTTGIFVRRTLEDFDIPEDCLGPGISDVTLYSPSRRSMQLRSENQEFRIGRMALFYNRYLAQCLRVQVEWLPETSYVGHTRSKEGLILRLEERTINRSVKARYLIGADGANSRVARELQLDVNREWIVGVEDVLINVPLDGPPRLHCFLDPVRAPGYLAWVAHDGEETHIGVGGYPSMFTPVRALESFHESLADIFPLKQARRIERRGGRIPVGGVLRHIANDCGLLIGDAAGAVSPLTAGGLDPCMRLSTLAASVVAEYLETGNVEVFKAYSGELFRARFASRLWMRRVVSNIRKPGLLELGCAALRLPLLNAFSWHVFFGRGSFPDVPMQTQQNLLPDAN
ncbi:MAG: NAD(P)/FAD-dependent oxidoreductase [Pyrinomonadaceae bacterium]